MRGACTLDEKLTFVSCSETCRMLLGASHEQVAEGKAFGAVFGPEHVKKLERRIAAMRQGTDMKQLVVSPLSDSESNLVLSGCTSDVEQDKVYHFIVVQQETRVLPEALLVNSEGMIIGDTSASTITDNDQKILQMQVKGRSKKSELYLGDTNEAVAVEMHTADNGNMLMKIHKIQSIEVVLEVDQQGVILSCSKAAILLFGRAASSLVGTSFIDLVIGNLTKGNRQVIRLKHADGSDFYCRSDIEVVEGGGYELTLRHFSQFLEDEEEDSDVSSVVASSALKMYEIEPRELGSGFNGPIVLAKHSLTGVHVAVKVIRKSLLEEHSLKIPPAEIDALRVLRYHPFIGIMYELKETPRAYVLVLEYCSGGDMFDLLLQHENGFSEPMARHYFRQLLQAVQYIHQNGFCHRDIKLDNVLIGSHENIKLIDFGFSTPWRKPDGSVAMLEEFCGTVDYAAPELFTNVPYDGRDADIWSLGVTLFVMLTARIPFGSPQDTVFAAVPWKSLAKTPGVKPLLSSIFRRNPGDRIRSVGSIMAHQWVGKGEAPPLRVPARDQMDPEIAAQLIELGFPRKQIEAAVRTRDSSLKHLNACYLMLATEKYKKAQFPGKEEQPAKRGKHATASDKCFLF